MGLGFLLLTCLAWAQNHSRLYELFRDEVIHLSQKVSRPQTPLAMLQSILQKHDVQPAELVPLLSQKSSVALAEMPMASAVSSQALALHAVSFTAHEISDAWMQDDVFCYFFVTDGGVPYGRVTATYRGLSAGEGFHFLPNERVIFPARPGFQVPQGHLTVDYGVVEADGDDTAQLQKLAGVVIDLAMAVYAAQDPRLASLLLNLRAEVKALAEALLNLEHDDRLVTGTLAWDNRWQQQLEAQGVVNVKRTHHSRDFWDSWKYELRWRWLKE